MRKRYCCIILAICLFASVLSGHTFAADGGQCGADVYWSLSGGTLTISGKGEMVISANDSWLKQPQSIKTVIIEDGVTTVAANAFKDCKAITSISIANSVTEIGEFAFCSCTNLTNINIPERVTTIEQYAFHHCKSLEKIVIPASVVNLGSELFGSCTALKNVTIEDGVTTIEVGMFRNCDSLRKVDIPNSVTSIKAAAFDGCTSLESISIPDSVTSIGSIAFYGCKSLTHISFPETLVDLGDRIFVYCSSLSSFRIPSCISVIPNMMFRGCSNLENVVIPESVSNIGDYAFYDCSSYTDTFFSGSRNQWENIAIGSANDPLNSSRIHVNVNDPSNHIHSFTVNPTCSDEGYTSKECACGFAFEKENVIPATGHKTKIVNAKSSTCTTSGYTGDEVCTVCKETIKKGTIIPASGHKTVLINEVEATCELQGYSGDTVCTYCGVTISQGSVIPAFGHNTELQNYVEATCSEAGYSGDEVCTICGKTIATGHKTMAVGHQLILRDYHQASCTEQGFTGDQVCTICGNLIKSGEVIPALGHTWGAWRVTKSATETDFGMKTRTCERCGENETQRIPKLTPSTPTNPFVDVSEGQYYTDAVLWAVNHQPQITNGTSPTTFSPNATCTRGQVVTFLWRANNCPEPKTTSNPFKDVKADVYYYKAVLWANENGITNGTSKTTFSPESPCARAHVVTFLWRSANKPAAGNSNPFTDVKAGLYYTDAVLWAVSKSITNGTSATTFSPDAPCTRGQIVTFLYRYLK